MANNNSPYGFEASIISGDTNKYATYAIASGYGSNLFRGDPVKLGPTGVNGHPTVVLATPGDTLVGIFHGCEYADYDGHYRFRNVWLGGSVSSGAKAHVYDVPYTKYRVQLSGAYADSMIGQLFDCVAGAGSKISGSSFALDSSTAGTGSQFKLTQVFDQVNNSPDTNAVVEVVMMKSWIR